jgi:hypothetical protein
VTPTVEVEVPLDTNGYGILKPVTSVTVMEASTLHEFLPVTLTQFLLSVLSITQMDDKN